MKPAPVLTRAALSMVDGAHEYMLVSDLSTATPSSASSSGSSTPRVQSPSPPSELSSAKAYSPQISPSSSLSRSGSYYEPRSASPVSFRYPFHGSPQHTLMSETPTPTAIRG